MTFDEILAQVLDLLQREKRLSYRALKARFGLDDDHLEALKDEIIEAKHLAVMEHCRTGESSEVHMEAVSQPLVSVLLPVWNAAATLPACLRSVQRQTESRWQCVMVDDGSQVGSLACARWFAERDPRFLVIATAHRGLVAALNTGLAHCRGRFVARMDANDLMHCQRLAAQVLALEDSPDLAAVGCHDAMWENVAIFGTPERVAERIAWLQHAGVENLIFFINYGGIANRKVLDSLELFATKVMPLFKD